MDKFVTIGKSKQFYDFLKNEILSGEYNPDDKFPSIRDLATRYGISSVTVNSVISNLVTEGLLYVEQGRGTFVASKKQSNRENKRMIGVMFFDFSLENNVEAGMFNSIHDNLTEDCYIIPYNSYNKLELFYKGIKGFTELGVDGMILVPPTSEDYDSGVVKKLIMRDIPVVFINRKIPGIKADFFTMDFEAVYYRAAKHLLNMNKKNIVLLKSDSEIHSEQMIKGYTRAHKEVEAACDSSLILEWQRETDKAEISLNRVSKRMDGLISSDKLIYRLRKAIYRSGKRIPDDLAIVGIGDTVYSRFMNPPLTAMPFPSFEIGKAAIKAILDKLDNGNTNEVSKAFETELVVRESSTKEA